MLTFVNSLFHDGFSNTVSTIVIKGMKKLHAIFKIIRPVNFLITFLSIVVAGIICNTGHFEIINVIYAGISGAIAAAGGNVINDYMDIEIDRINKPDRALPSGILTNKEVLLLYSVFIAASVVLAILINIYALIVVIISNLLIFLYSFRIKRVPLLGNIFVAFFTCLAFIYWGIAVNNLLYALIPAVFAFMINLIRELVKDMEDVIGDRAQNIITFPQKYGFKKTNFLTVGLAVILMLLTVIPFVFNIYKIEYFIVVMLTVNLMLVYFISKIGTENSKGNYSKLSALLKVSMIFGLAAIYLGV